MRMLCIIFTALLLAAGYAHALESDVYSLNPGPVPASALVSFSVGYPKAWGVSEDSSLQRHDIYNGLAIGPGTGPICSFWQTATNRLEHGITSYQIWRSYDATAKAAAERFSTNTAPLGIYTQSVGPVKTAAGDSGWLVESTGTTTFHPAVFRDLSPSISGKPLGEKIPIVYHNFFFHVGNKGAIRIEIITQTDNSSWRSDLDQLVLQTLCFNDH